VPNGLPTAQAIAPVLRHIRPRRLAAPGCAAIHYEYLKFKNKKP